MKAATKLELVSENQQIQQENIAAQEAHQVMLLVAEHEKQSWIVLGRAARSMKLNDWWKLFAHRDGVAYHSWNDYVEDIFEKGRSTVYRALGLIEVFGHLPDDVLAKITVTKAIALMNLSERQRISPEWIARAQALSTVELEDAIFDSLEGAAQPEQKRKIVFKNVPKSLVKIVEKALAVAEWIGEVDTDNDKLELIVSDFLSAPWQDEANLAKKVPLSNEQSYLQRDKKRVRS